ncbi:hypothetical protein BH23GEM9_BH23GEM9_24340 [soil metagenome]
MPPVNSRRVAASLLIVLAACSRPDERREGFLVDDEPFDVAPMACDVAPPPAGTPTIQVVFSCDEVAVGSWRALPEAVTDTLSFALTALLEGPTPQERSAGLDSFFSAETAGMLNHATVRDGVAYVDFRNFAGIIPNASTSAGSAQLLDQLAGTIFQFDDIGEAEISFEGSCDVFWNWLQRGCQRLTRGGP